MAKGHSPSQGQHHSDGLIYLGGVYQRSLKAQRVTVAATATKIPTSPLSRRKNLIIINSSTVIVYIGASDVDTTDGFPVYQRSSVLLNIEDKVDVYGRVVTGTANINILEGA